MPRRDEGFFASKDGTRLFWRQETTDAEPKAWLGVVHGYGDHCGRYQKPIEAFVKDGFGVLTFDYRGHGKADGDLRASQVASRRTALIRPSARYAK